MTDITYCKKMSVGDLHIVLTELDKTIRILHTVYDDLRGILERVNSDKIYEEVRRTQTLIGETGFRTQEIRSWINSIKEDNDD